jgi:FAD/FMN-containing dehydrogenase
MLNQATAVQPFNQNLPVTPAAVTFPKSREEVAAVVQCAAEHGYRVQAKGGGHSYANHGMSSLNFCDWILGLCLNP